MEINKIYHDMKKILALAIVAMPLAAAAITPLWLRDAQIAPDGKQIVFTYKGDLWTVPASGGEAARLTSTEAYEQKPLWSPDSKTIAFAANHYGSNDIYTIPATGGTPTRLTFDNSASELPAGWTPDGKNVLFSAAIQDPVTSAMFPSSRMTELYSVPAAGGKMKQVLGTPALDISYLPDGRRWLYMDVKGFEDEWRKHHTSSDTRDIWLYDPSTGKHTNLTARQGEDRNPVAAGDEFYFLSERNGGSMNVYRASLSRPAELTAVTNFKTHPVRFLSRAKDGKLCFTYDGEIYTLAPGGKPAKVNISLTADEMNTPRLLSNQPLRWISASPDGKELAFIARGEVFVTSADYATTKQITDTPEAESDVTWGKDSRTLYYVSERDGNYNIYRAEIGREDDPNFANATIIKEEKVFKTDGHERTSPQLSPDGKKLAFVLDRNKLAVMDMDSKKVTELTDARTNPQRRGHISYSWSPDSRWIALEVITRKHEPYGDIAVVNADTKEMINITNSGYFDESPRWAYDGNAIIFATERYGMRNHASWGSLSDVMIAFLNREAYDKYLLSKEDAELAAEAEKKAKKDEKDDKKDKKDDKKGDKKDEVKPIVIEPDGIEDRTVRLTPFSSELSDAFVTSDGKTLYFIATTGNDNTLWKRDMRSGKTTSAKTLPSGLRGFEITPDGKKIFIAGSKIQKFDPSGDKLTAVDYSSSLKMDAAKEREFMFDNMVREERQRFYDVKMHGVDWTALTGHYRRFLPHISNNADLAEMMSELLGELNVSHTGSRASLTGASIPERTASLGLLYDLDYDGDGLKVAEVVKGGPFDNDKSEVTAGTIIDSINGRKITAKQDHTSLLCDLTGKKTLVAWHNPSTGAKGEEVVRPVSAGKMSSLLYRRWVKSRAEAVDRLSGGRLGYVHISSMDDDSFREVYSDLLGKYNDREGVVVDIRWNGGGRLHEDVEVLLSGKKYLTQVIRGVESCDMPSRRWNKPSIMLMCEACYSNAHGTPWVYKNRGIGKLVGMPVPGTMTSVNWQTMQDPSIYFGIPVIGYRTAEGTYLENSELEPDVKVANDPAEIVKGEDAQLRVAVETLLREIDGKKK